jgi:hypothetical protein
MGMDRSTIWSYLGLLNQGETRVVNNQSGACPRLWISYPWIRNEERDFAYLVPQLKAANIEAVYDSFQLQPNSRLGQRIVQRLLSIGFDGWLYILTHQCFTRRNYTDELTEAIDQTLLHMGPEFPMAGLMYGIATQQVPPVLRVLPCISLGDPDWKRQLSTLLNSDAIHSRKAKVNKETRFVWKIHPCFDGDASLTAVEVHTKEDRIQYWRFAAPKSAKIVRWGQGRAGGGEISRIIFAETKGSGRYENRDVIWFGAANTISDMESAYVVFSEPLPDFIGFGPAQTPFGSPGKMEMLWPALMKQN